MKEVFTKTQQYEVKRTNQVKNTRLAELQRLSKRSVLKTSLPNNSRIKTTDFEHKFDSIQERVASILRTDKYARENDLWLIIMYYSRMGMLKLIVPEENFSKASSPESITRARRKIIEEAKKGKKEYQFILGKNEQSTLTARKVEEKKYREHFRNEKMKEEGLLAKDFK